MADKKQDAQAGTLYWVRITLTSQAVKPLEKVAEDVKARAKDKNLKLKGPIRLPTKVIFYAFFNLPLDSQNHHP